MLLLDISLVEKKSYKKLIHKVNDMHLDEDAIVEQTIQFVKKELAQAEAGHDWLHVERVYQSALEILETEPTASTIIVKLGALLHDIADAKFHDGDETIGPQKATTWMRSLILPSTVIKHVVSIIQHISFKNSLEKNSFQSLELYIVRDADRLDALGAIGIARCFHYGGYKNNPIYDPFDLPRTTLDKSSYILKPGPSINHFFEKLLTLKDKFHTTKGKSMALVRHDFLISFLNQFFSETKTTNNYPQTNI